MTTIHSYTNDQRILDLPHKDLRRARAAALSMIPTTTGAAKAIGEVLPSSRASCNGISVRVPTPERLAGRPDREPRRRRPRSRRSTPRSRRPPRARSRACSQYTDEPTVSIDYNGNPHSAIFDATNTFVIDGNLVKVFAWYDNEWGFSNRMVDVGQVSSPRAASLLAKVAHAVHDHRRAAARREAGLHPRRLQRPARRAAARSPTTRASARRCRPSSTRCRPGAQGRSSPRTSGGRRAPDPKLSLEPAARAGSPSCSASSTRCSSPTTASATACAKLAQDLKPGQVLLLENLRFHPEEEANDEAFARELAALCRRLRQRRLRHRAPRPRLDRRDGAVREGEGRRAS